MDTPPLLLQKIFSNKLYLAIFRKSDKIKKEILNRRQADVF